MPSIADCAAVVSRKMKAGEINAALHGIQEHAKGKSAEIEYHMWCDLGRLGATGDQAVYVSTPQGQRDSQGLMQGHARAASSSLTGTTMQSEWPLSLSIS